MLAIMTIEKATMRHAVTRTRPLILEYEILVRRLVMVRGENPIDSGLRRVRVRGSGIYTCLAAPRCGA